MVIAVVSCRCPLWPPTDLLSIVRIHAEILTYDTPVVSSTLRYINFLPLCLYREAFLSCCISTTTTTTTFIRTGTKIEIIYNG